MGWPKGKTRKVVGGSVRSDAAPSDVQQVWKTDVLEGQDPGFSYQYMRENEVRDRGLSKRVYNRDTGTWEKVSGWTVVQEGEVQASRERPDLAVPVDTSMRMGPHVLMKIPTADWDLLQHEKDAVADAHATRMMAGSEKVQTSPVVEEFEDVAKIRQQFFAPHPALMGGFQGGR